MHSSDNADDTDIGAKEEPNTFLSATGSMQQSDSSI